MGIQRTPVAVQADFVRLPNAWMRDERLSRRARGLLGELMTHRVGWHVSIASLQKAGPEGRDAIRSAVAELVKHKYLRLSQGRGERGRFNEIEYELCTPPTANGLSDTGGKPDTGGFTDVGSAVSGSSDVGESATKKTSSSEDHSQEDQSEEEHVQDEPAHSLDSDFDEFWEVAPRKQAKADARKAYKAARKTTDHATIMAGIRAYALLAAGSDKQFLKLPAGWLRSERWADEQIPLSPAKPTKEQGVIDVLALGRRMHAECPNHPGYPAATNQFPCAACDREALPQGVDF